jgi:hypothetical protein
LLEVSDGTNNNNNNNNNNSKRDECGIGRIDGIARGRGSSATSPIFFEHPLGTLPKHPEAAAPKGFIPSILQIPHSSSLLFPFRLSASRAGPVPVIERFRRRSV